jgi:DNA-binding transcriptional ArsR family regulator
MKEIINHEQIKMISKVAVVLRKKIRKEILNYLDLHGDTTVTELYIRFRMEQCTMSTELASLRSINAVKYKIKGKNIYYSVNYQTMKVLIQASDNVSLMGPFNSKMKRNKNESTRINS